MTSGAERIAVLVVDDHVMVAEGIVHALRIHDDLDVIGHATSRREAVARARASRPDVVLTDFRLPDGDGADVAAEIAEHLPATRVVVMTSFTSDPVVRACLQAGCAGVVAKEHCLEEGLNAIRAAARGDTYLTSAMLSRVIPGRERSGEPKPLTPRERDILTMLARGYSTKRIASELFLSVKTVRNHVQNVNLKLQVHSKLEAVTKAIREGLIVAPEQAAGT